MSIIDSKDNTFGSDNGHNSVKEEPAPNARLAGLEVSRL